MFLKQGSDISCIYRITNIVNGKFYIGSAVNYRKRRNLHLHSLRHDKHHSRYLQASFNFHGEEKFLFQILAECPRRYLAKMEQWFLDTQKPNYNSSKSAVTSLGYKRTPEQNARRSESMRGRKLSEETKQKLREINTGKKASAETIMRQTKQASCIEVFQFDLCGEFLASYQSIRAANKSTGVYYVNISSCMRNIRKTAGGYIWLNGATITQAELQDRVIVKKKH